MDQNTVWVIAIAALIIGTLLGFLFGRSGSNGSREVQLANDLEKAQLDLERYRDEVNQHFSKTAELVNGLTNQYQKVHQHLAESAETLVRDEKLVASLKSSAGSQLEDKSTASSTQAEPPTLSMPLDYAPKREDEPGTLSDNFGLHSEIVENPADPAKVYNRDEKSA